MRKVILGPLDSKAAETIAQRRGISVDELVHTLIHEEATIELTHWREPQPPTAPQPIQPQPAPAVRP
jgi:hypothetical protein